MAVTVTWSLWNWRKMMMRMGSPLPFPKVPKVRWRLRRCYKEAAAIASSDRKFFRQQSKRSQIALPFVLEVFWFIHKLDVFWALKVPGQIHPWCVLPSFHLKAKTCLNWRQASFPSLRVPNGLWWRRLLAMMVMLMAVLVRVIKLVKVQIDLGHQSCMGRVRTQLQNTFQCKNTNLGRPCILNKEKDTLSLTHIGEHVNILVVTTLLSYHWQLYGEAFTVLVAMERLLGEQSFFFLPWKIFCSPWKLPKSNNQDQDQSSWQWKQKTGRGQYCCH